MGQAPHAMRPQPRLHKCTCYASSLHLNGSVYSQNLQSTMELAKALATMRACRADDRGSSTVRARLFKCATHSQACLQREWKARPPYMYCTHAQHQMCSPTLYLQIDMKGSQLWE